MEIKLQCGCGTRYKFEVEPINGRLPSRALCPSCGVDGTADANQFIAQNAAPIAAGSEATGLGLRMIPPPELPIAAARAPRSEVNLPLLERSTFFVKERVGFLKLADIYDILDPATGATIGIAKEEPPVWAKWLRLVVNKSLLPTAINIYETEGEPPALSIQRGFTFLRSKIKVVASDGESLGYFKSKLLSIGGGFDVFNNSDEQVAEVKGNWKGWDFRFLTKEGREIGTVTKKWAGLGKELFSSADNYIISLSDARIAGPAASTLLLAAGLAIDVVFKEKN